MLLPEPGDSDVLDVLEDALSSGGRLIADHEMGELFKVIAFGRGLDFQPLGFASGDRTHRL